MALGLALGQQNPMMCPKVSPVPRMVLVCLAGKAGRGEPAEPLPQGLGCWPDPA